MELPEIGSKWVAKVDSPRLADVNKGDVVEVSGVNEVFIIYTGDWCCLPSEWHNNFEPYQKDKPKFQVGDKVKCLHPTIVYSGFKGEVGVVTRTGLAPAFNQTVEILYGNCTQVAYPGLDGVVLVESAQEKTPTESTAGANTPKDIVELLSVSEDNVNSPSHYGQGNIEAIEYIKDFLTKEEYIGYLRGNIAKYLHRWRYKNGVEDLEKARVYLGWLIEGMGDG